MDHERALAIGRAARALIADPAHWTSRALARDGIGDPVPPQWNTAVSFCALGAVSRVTNGNEHETQEFFRHLYRFTTLHIAIVNDRCGHAAVLDLFDRAIVSLQAESRQLGTDEQELVSA
jgi:hypothetical protein